MKKRFLENAPLFAMLAEDERQALAERFVLCKFEEGVTLFQQAQPPHAMFLIRSGIVKLTERQGDRERTLATFGPSSLLGEIDLLLDRPYETTAVAQGQVDGWSLSREALSEVMSAKPSMSIKLSSFLGERIADVDGYLVGRLEKLSILADLDHATLAALAETLVLQDARRGALIFQAGSTADSLYLVESGTVTIVSTAPDDPEPFRQLGPGEMFGHEAMLRNRKYGAVARAATDVQLWALSRAEFERVAAAHPALRQVLADYLSEQSLAPADRNAARQALEAAPIFEGLSAEVLDAIAIRLSLRHVGTNETIYTAGDPGDAFFLIDRGVVKMLDGPELVERRESGQFFGEMALLTGKPRSLTARAARNTNLWVLAKRDFDALSVRHPDLTTTVSRALAQAIARDSVEGLDSGLNLSMFPLFTGLTPKEQADVARRLRTMSVRAQEVIFRKGAVADAFYLVQRGQVKLLGEHGHFDVARTGGFFGEMALLTGNAQSFTALAMEDSELLVLDRNQFEAVVNRYSSVSLVLSRALGARLEAASSRVPSQVAVEAVTGIREAPVARTRSASSVTVHLPSGTKGGGRVLRSRSPWPRIRLFLVAGLLAWLVGITAPTLVLNSASEDESSPFRPLLEFVSPPDDPSSNGSQLPSNLGTSSESAP